VPFLHHLRTRLALRQRFRDPVAAKHDAQLRWWLETWDAEIRDGGLKPQDALDFLPGEEVETTYWGRRWQLARSQVARVMDEAGIEDQDYFAGKVVVEVGPGPLGFPDACPARISLGVDPLARRYAEHGLLLPDSAALYITASAEALPLITDSADVVLARDTLDYVDDPERALTEFRRILKPGGRLILMFDVGHVPTPFQPNALTADGVKAQLAGLTVVREHHWPEPFGADGHRAVIVVDAPQS
jgi:SAM-dependent methyltransferase